MIWYAVAKDQRRKQEQAPSGLVLQPWLGVGNGQTLGSGDYPIAPFPKLTPDDDKKQRRRAVSIRGCSVVWPPSGNWGRDCNSWAQKSTPCWASYPNARWTPLQACWVVWLRWGVKDSTVAGP